MNQVTRNNDVMAKSLADLLLSKGILPTEDSIDIRNLDQSIQDAIVNCMTSEWLNDVEIPVPLIRECGLGGAYRLAMIDAFDKQLAGDVDAWMGALFKESAA